jgi:hypothetical protein
MPFSDTAISRGEELAGLNWPTAYLHGEKSYMVIHCNYYMPVGMNASSSQGTLYHSASPHA